MKKDQDDLNKQPIPTEDKVLLGLLAVFALGVILGVRWVMVAVFDAAVGASAGVGFREAFIASLVISFFLIVVFALVAGDGALGELTMVIFGFFLMVAFFTISIAVIL
ncbi:MAG: hypothetical protein GDA52_11510 [Rhodobacteraceae bacterium]|nr:hypothetical protein [Paracoccaceae bacterium]